MIATIQKIAVKNVIVKCVPFIIFPFRFEHLVYQGNMTGLLQKQLTLGFLLINSLDV